MIMPTDREVCDIFLDDFIRQRDGDLKSYTINGVHQVLHLIRARAIDRFFWPCALSTALALMLLGLGTFNVWHGEYIRALFAAAATIIAAVVSINLSNIANEFISIADLDEPEEK